MNLIKTGVLFIFLTFLLLLTGALIGGGDPSIVLIFLFIALAMNILGFWFSDKLVLSMSRAKLASQDEAPELHSVVDEQVHLAGIPKPKVFIMDSDSPNAFATGRSKKKASIAVTRGIMRILNRDELGAVIAHELAHVGNRDTLIMTMVAAVAGAITMIAWMAQWSLIFGGMSGRRGGGGGSAIGLIGLLVVVIVMPLGGNSCAAGHIPHQGVPGRPYGRGDVRQTIWPWPAHWQSSRRAAMHGAWTYPKSALSLFLTCSL